ncbi:MAG: Lrp/AsnC family transcriptional regulator [Candidatus Bathyarchaeota archaeon]|nr:Lrp/AsnC family transcriptional regulator [Candidatus Bathyarchaeota archaeon]
MDEIDLQIIKELTRNPQISFLKIAKKIGVSPITVQRKHTKMKEERTLLQSSITIDLSQLGYNGKAYIMITNAPNQERTTTMEALRQMQDVFICTEILGNFDLLAIAAVKNLRSIICLVNSIRKIPSVDRVEIALTADTAFPVSRDFNTLLSNINECP